MTGSECIFCRIVSGESPAHIVYEDQHVLALLDYRPVQTGHCLVIPKTHIDYFTNLEDGLAAHIIMIGNRLGRKMLQEIKPTPKRIGFVIHGAIPHVHYHVVPLYDEDEIASGKYAFIHEGRVAFDAAKLPIADYDVQTRLANLLRIS